jgi:hypothetical protein
VHDHRWSPGSLSSPLNRYTQTKFVMTSSIRMSSFVAARKVTRPLTRIGSLVSEYPLAMWVA